MGPQVGRRSPRSLVSAFLLIAAAARPVEAQSFTALSADGRFLAFASVATNLVPGDAHGFQDVFVHDRMTGHTELVSVASDGTQGNGRSFFPALSADGRFVAFVSSATDLVLGD